MNSYREGEGEILLAVSLNIRILNNETGGSIHYRKVRKEVVYRKFGIFCMTDTVWREIAVDIAIVISLTFLSLTPPSRRAHITYHKTIAFIAVFFIFLSIFS